MQQYLYYYYSTDALNANTVEVVILNFPDKNGIVQIFVSFGFFSLAVK